MVASSVGIDISTDPADLDVGSTDNDGIAYNGTGDLSLNNNAILNVLKIVGKNNIWTIDENGLLITKVTTSEGDKYMYGMVSESAEVTLSGTGTLQMGEAVIVFATNTQEIIDELMPINVSVTLTSIEAKGVAVVEKSTAGFTVKELDNGESNATFDWIVIAKRKAITIESSSDMEIIDTESSSDLSGDEISVGEELTQAGEEDETTDSSSSPASDSFEEPLVEEPLTEESQIIEEPADEFASTEEVPETPSEPAQGEELPVEL